MQTAPSAGQPSTVKIGPADGIAGGGEDAGGPPAALPPAPDHDDRLNYALLLALYTLQGIPMGLSASIPFLIQQRVQALAASAHAAGSGAAAALDAASGSGGADHPHSLAELTKTAYNAQAIFALCS